MMRKKQDCGALDTYKLRLQKISTTGLDKALTDQTCLEGEICVRKLLFLEDFMFYLFHCQTTFKDEIKTQGGIFLLFFRSNLNGNRQKNCSSFVHKIEPNVFFFLLDSSPVKKQNLICFKTKTNFCFQ